MKYYGLELIEQLCREFGPSGCCDPVREALAEQITDVIDAYTVDRVGNVLAKVCGSGEGYNAKNPKKVLICTGMDEVGMIINRVSDKGHLKFSLVGDIDARCLGGKSLLVGDGNRRCRQSSYLLCNSYFCILTNKIIFIILIRIFIFIFVIILV